MAVTIRLSRLGKKHKPFYRVIATDKKRKRESRYLEKIGEYNPLLEKDQLKIDNQRFKFWITKGAEVSKGLARLLKKYSFRKD